MIKIHIHRQSGYTLTEALVGVAIVAIVMTSMFALFTLGIESVQRSKARTIATSIAQRQMETIRNMPYTDIGISGGWPSGDIEATQSVTESDTTFTMTTTVQFVDDPFDGLVTDPVTPDVFPWDYKKVQIEMQSPDFENVAPVLLTSHFAPDGIESEDNRGTLLIHVIDANGAPVSTANVHVTNEDPAIDAAQLSNVDGDVFFYALEPDSEGYHIVVSRDGYSTAQTYTVDLDPASPTYNPNPNPADATIVVGEVTEITLAIDEVSMLGVNTVQEAIASEWVINTDGGSEDQTDPAMTINPATGNPSFIWNDFRNNKWNTYSQEYDPDTHDPALPDDVQADGQANQDGPAIANDAAGNLFLAWSDNRNGNLDVYLKKFDAAGNDIWAGPKKIDASVTSADQIRPSVAIDSAGGCRIVWQDDRDDSGDIYFHRCDADGNFTLPDDVRIDDSGVDSLQSFPQIVRDTTVPDDEFYILWQDERSDGGDIYISRVGSDGVAMWGANTRVNLDGNGTQIAPEMSLTPDGDVVVVWQDDRNGNWDVMMQKIAPDGSRIFGGDFVVGHALAGSNQTTPSVAVMPDGRFAVVWVDDRFGDNSIMTTVYNGDGTQSWVDDVLLNTDVDGAEQLSPNVEVLPDGRLVFSWADQRNGDWDIYGAVYPGDPGTAIVPNVPLIIRGAKTIGSYPNPAPPPDSLDLYKFEISTQTDENGSLLLTDMEWDTYSIEVQIPYSLNQSTPPLPVFLPPGSTTQVELNVSN